jgi:hypothetical protein
LLGFSLRAFSAVRWRDWSEKQDAAAREGHPVPPSRSLRTIRAFAGALGLAVVSLLILVPMAFAAPPANDKFEDAQVLGPGLPVLVPGSNVGATKESSGEPFNVFAAGHSVWFSWTAPDDEVVTVDTCNSNFSTILTVFVGSSLGVLTKVGEDENSDGRSCPDAAGVTFRAESGTSYSILVDGDGFGFPEGPPPVTEGSFELKVEATPSPANNDFADAVELSGSSFGGFYGAHVDGYNWNATKEAGESEHAGDPGGASVWYRWTAPASGHAELGACSSFDVLLGVYTGNAVDALSPVPLESRPAPCFVNFTATAGATYRIAIDGRFDTGTGLPHMSSFDLHAFMEVPEPSAGGKSIQSSNPPDKTPPNTTIRKQVLRSQPPVLVFHFSSNEANSTFRCKLDKGTFHKCHSPRRVDPAARGRHVLSVVAVDKAGNVDPTPAVVRFGVAGKSHTRN